MKFLNLVLKLETWHRPRKLVVSALQQAVKSCSFIYFTHSLFSRVMCDESLAQRSLGSWWNNNYWCPTSKQPFTCLQGVINEINCQAKMNWAPDNAHHSINVRLQLNLHRHAPYYNISKSITANSHISVAGAKKFEAFLLEKLLIRLINH